MPQSDFTQANLDDFDDEGNLIQNRQRFTPANLDDFDEDGNVKIDTSVGDYLKAPVAGALKAAGYGIRGIGQFTHDLGDKLRQGVNATLGTDFKPDEDMLRGAGDYVTGLGTAVDESMTPGAKAAIQGFNPSGNVFTGENLSFGENVTPQGVGLRVLDTFGQIAPIAATALATRGGSLKAQLAKSAGVSATMGGGAAATEEGERIRRMGNDVESLSQIPAYNALREEGVDHASAVEDVARIAESGAFWHTAPVSALTGLIVGGTLSNHGQRALSKIVGEGRIGRILGGVAIDAPMEGAQEAAESYAQRYGAGATTGEQRDPGEDSFGEFLLGAAGGGAVAAGGALLPVQKPISYGLKQNNDGSIDLLGDGNQTHTPVVSVRDRPDGSVDIVTEHVPVRADSAPPSVNSDLPAEDAPQDVPAEQVGILPPEFGGPQVAPQYPGAQSQEELLGGIRNQSFNLAMQQDAEQTGIAEDERLADVAQQNFVDETQQPTAMELALQRAKRPAVPQDEQSPPSTDILPKSGKPFVTAKAALLWQKQNPKFVGHQPVNVGVKKWVLRQAPEVQQQALMQEELQMGENFSPKSPSSESTGYAENLGENNAPAQQSAPAMSYDEFKAQYTDAFNSMMKYPPNQAGSSVFAEKMAKLADDYPDFADAVEADAAENQPVADLPELPPQLPENLGAEPRASSSWVIKNKETGEVIAETFDHKKVDALNTAKYEAVPILEHLQGVAKAAKSEPQILAPEKQAAPQVSPQPVAAKSEFTVSADPIADGIVRFGQVSKDKYHSYLRARMGKTKFAERAQEIEQAWANQSKQAAPQNQEPVIADIPVEKSRTQVEPERSLAPTDESQGERIPFNKEKRAIYAEKLKPVLNLDKSPTGWSEIQNANGTALVHPHEDYALKFQSKNERSGTEALRARALAQAFAIDNPIAPRETPKGDLEVRPMFDDKNVKLQEKERKAPDVEEGNGDLFTQKSKQVDIEDVTKAASPADEVDKAKAALDAAGVTGVDRTTTIAAVRRGDLTAEDVVESHPQSLAPDVKEKLTTDETKETDKGVALYSKRVLTPEDDFVSTAVTLLAESDDIFQRPASDKKTLGDISKEIDPEMQVTVSGDLLPIHANGGKDGKAWSIKMPDGSAATIKENRNEVWIDASRLESTKSGGTLLYQLAGTYAHNNGKVFIGDPDGLSDAAMRRRTESMLSLALKFGTTDFMLPHPKQTDGDAKIGVKPLKWKVGDTAFNLRQLVKASYDNTVFVHPELESIVYDFDARDFKNSNTGESVGDGVFESLTRTSGMVRRRMPTGSTTAKRAAIFNTILREASGGRGGRLLAAIGRELQVQLSDALKGTFYSRQEAGRSPGLSVSEATTQLSDLIGARSAQALLDSGRIVLVEDEGKMPGGMRSESKMTRAEFKKFMTAAHEDEALVESISEIVYENDEIVDFGIRVIPDGYEVKDGEKIGHSYEWVDGEITDNELDGTSAIDIPGDANLYGIRKALRVIAENNYFGRQLVLIKGQRTGGGQDFMEGVFSDATVVKILNPEAASKYSVGQSRDTTLGVTTSDGVMHLNLAALSAKDFDGVALHEGIHGALKSLIGAADFDRLIRRMDNLRKMSKDGTGEVGKFFREAIAAVPNDTPAADVSHEVAAYAVERYTNAPRSLPQSIVKWAKDFIAAIRTGLMRALPQGSKLRGKLLDSASEADLARLAIVGLRRAAKGAEASVGDGVRASKTSDHFPDAGKMVDGRRVLSSIPNQGSISASLDDYTILDNVREIPFSAFTQMPELKYYSTQEEGRTKRLAKEIELSGEITPLIVVIDSEGPYVLEGGHRFDALREIGAKSFPALVVLDNSQTQQNPDIRYSKRNTNTAAIQSLNNAIAKQRGDDKWRNAYAPAPADVLEKVRDVARAFKSVFGAEVVPVVPTSAEFDGLPGKYHQGALFIDANDKHYGFVQLAGHELLHDLKRKAPGLYAHLANQARTSGIDVEGYRQKLNANLTPGEAAFDVESAEEELLADFTGDALSDPEFLSSLAESNPTKFRMLLDTVRAWLKRVLGKLTDNGYGSSAYFKDVSELRDYLGAVLSVYADTRKAESIASIEPPKYSRRMDDDTDPPNIIDRLQKDAQSSVLQRLKDKAADWQPNLLGALTLQQIVDIGQKYLPQMKQYERSVAKMRADVTEMQQGAAKLAEKWAKWARANKPAAQRLSQVMHDATLWGTDPEQAFVPLDKNKAREQIEVLKEKMRGRSGDDKAEMMAEMKSLKSRINTETQRSAMHAEMKKRFATLPKEARDLYAEVRDSYVKQSEEMFKALEARINGSESAADVKRSILDKLRIKFEQARLDGPYFPLARFGEYWAEMTDTNGERLFLMFEDAGERRSAIKRLEKEGHKLNKQGRKLDNSKELSGTSAAFMGEVSKMLDKVGGSKAEEFRDALYQLYLHQLPDMSMRKAFIHRQKVKGFSEDGLRAYAYKMFHGANQVARLRHSTDMEQSINSMKEQAKAEPDSTKHTTLINEMQKRHQWIMNPGDSGWANKLTGLGFFWHLGLGASSALVNLTQTPVVAMPVIASKFGFGKASASLLKASTDFIGKRLTADERAMLDSLEKRGYLDRTLGHDLAGIGDSPTGDYSERSARAMRAVSFLFHHAERFNREVTALAAYRLAGKGEASIDYAAEVVDKAHFNYGNENRARWMQSNTAKVLLLFKQYALNMSYYLWRNAHQMLKGESPEVRKAAFKQLTGTLGMTGLMAGASGLPLYGVMMTVANAMASLFGDDDEWDAEREFYAWLKENAGKDGADRILRGAASDMTGIDISSRTQLDGLWLRAPDKELEGKAYAHYLLEQAAGPVVGGILTNTLRGIELMGEGETQRGFEAMSPKFARDAIRAFRYADEGARSLRGDPLIDKFNPWELATQVGGFTPERLAEKYDSNTRVKNAEQAILDKRSKVMAAYSMALLARDQEGIEKARAKVTEFNKKHPRMAISGKDITQSAMSRARYSAQAKDGIIVNRRLQGELERYH